MDFQDQVNHVTYKVATKIVVTTAEQLLKAFPFVLHKIREFEGKEGKIVHGKQSLKKLNLQNRELTSIEIPDEDMKAIQREFKKYAVDFSAFRDKETGTAQLHFKAQDVERVYAALTHVVRDGIDQPKSKRLDDVIKQAKARAEQWNQAHSREQSRQRGRQHDRTEPAK